MRVYLILERAKAAVMKAVTIPIAITGMNVMPTSLHSNTTG